MCLNTAISLQEHAVSSVLGKEEEKSHECSSSTMESFWILKVESINCEGSQ